MLRVQRKAPFAELARRARTITMRGDRLDAAC
jgi:hypothetical protein